MNKKRYIKPQMRELECNLSTAMLAGSNQGHWADSKKHDDSMWSFDEPEEQATMKAYGQASQSLFDEEW